MATYAYTFTSGDTLTPTKLNNNRTVSEIVNADIKSDAAIAGSKLADGGIVTAKILDANVTTAKIADANVTPAKLSQPLTLATAQATTSGTSIDFTGIPSWAKRITVMLNGVSTGGSSIPILQIGDSGGIEATGYTAGASDFASYQSQTTGFPITRSWANTFIFSGIITIAALDSAANTWVASGSVNDAGGSAVFSMGGAKSLSATLDRVRLTTVNGTDTFDAGSVNIMYEG